MGLMLTGTTEKSRRYGVHAEARDAEENEDRQHGFAIPRVPRGFFLNRRKQRKQRGRTTKSALPVALRDARFFEGGSGGSARGLGSHAPPRMPSGQRLRP